MNTIGQLWHPIWLLWWTVIGVPIHAVLKTILSFLSGNSLAESIGPFGIAIVLLTIVIKLIISPIFQYQLTTALSTAGFDDLDAARTRHAGAESVDFNPLALLWLVGTLHGNDWFRALTIAWRCRGATLVPSICGRPVRRCAYGISDCAANRHLLLFRCPGELRQVISTTYAHEAGETSIDFSTFVGSLCIS